MNEQEACCLAEVAPNQVLATVSSSTGEGVRDGLSGCWGMLLERQHTCELPAFNT